jgi:putative transposase
MAYRYRLYAEPGQTTVLERHCADARFVWNLALEQLNLRLAGPRPGSAERFRQLADARDGRWLGEGSSSV